MLDLISVIVPVYNVADYLEKCVESILAQTYKNIEVILVDDGSTDGLSGTLCDELAKRNERIRVIHKENGGLSDARNIGIREAKGNYIGLIDSDDYIDEDMYEVLYQNMIDQGADLSICGIYQVYGNRIEQPVKQEVFTASREEAVRMVLESSQISVNAVNRLYPKKVFEQVAFPYGKTSEDAHVVLEILNQVNKVVVDLHPKYYYIHRNGSITTSEYKPGDMSVIEAYEKNYETVKADYPELVTVAKFRRFWARFYVLDKMLLSENFTAYEERKQLVRFLRKNTGSILRNNYVGKGRKIASLGLFFHIRLYKIFLKKYRKGRERL